MVFVGVLCTSVLYSVKQKKEQRTFETVWGETIELDDLSLSLINTKIMQRIKDVDQSGPARFFGPKLPKFTRFNHSLGVMALIMRANGSKKEQAAALLHDASHTVFSHVGDHIFVDKNNSDKYTDSSYQDSIHMKYIKNAKLSNIILKFGLDEKDLDPEHTRYKSLEQPLPNMCADRIEYNVHTGVLLGVISKTEAKEIIEDLSYQDGQWFFTDPKLALKLAEISVYFTQNFWGAKWNTLMNIHLAAALRRALKLKLIKYDDLYTTDSVVMRKLLKNQDKFLQTCIQQCKIPMDKIPGQSYVIIHFKPKFRGIDPLIKNSKIGKLVHLTEIDMIFKHHYEAVQEWCKHGYEINVLKDAY